MSPFVQQYKPLRDYDAIMHLACDVTIMRSQVLHGYQVTIQTLKCEIILIIIML